MVCIFFGFVYFFMCYVCWIRIVCKSIVSNLRIFFVKVVEWIFEMDSLGIFLMYLVILIVVRVLNV